MAYAGPSFASAGPLGPASLRAPHPIPLPFPFPPLPFLPLPWIRLLSLPSPYFPALIFLSPPCP